MGLFSENLEPALGLKLTPSPGAARSALSGPADAEAADDLGVETACGKRRATATQRKRLTKSLARAKRVGAMAAGRPNMVHARLDDRSVCRQRS